MGLAVLNQNLLVLNIFGKYLNQGLAKTRNIREISFDLIVEIQNMFDQFANLGVF